VIAITVAAATPLEAKCARRALPQTRVVETGVALAKLRGGGALGDVVISCGLAGGLHRDLHTGTVVIPRTVLRPDGTTMTCDPDLTQALTDAARSLGTNCVLDPIVTPAHIVTGDDRLLWAQRGYAGVDMETGMLHAPRIAAVRVLLDTPLRELSEEWLHPHTAILKPWLWPEALWLARHAPRCADLAARIVRRMLDSYGPPEIREG
jgi:hypothetical protein